LYRTCPSRPTEKTLKVLKRKSDSTTPGAGGTNRSGVKTGNK
jgi:hypothetical protein